MTTENTLLAPPDEEALQAAKHFDFLLTERLIAEWMRTANQETPNHPTLATYAVRQLRHRLIEEELGELAVAYELNDLVGVADAITDLLYVVVGSAVAHGLNLKALFLAVHNNNCQKIANGHIDPITTKFIKPDNHLPPDLNAILVQQWRSAPIRADGEAVTCSKCDNINRDHCVESIYSSLPEPIRAGRLELTVLCDGRRVKL